MTISSSASRYTSATRSCSRSFVTPSVHLCGSTIPRCPPPNSSARRQTPLPPQSPLLPPQLVSTPCLDASPLIPPHSIGAVTSQASRSFALGPCPSAIPLARPRASCLPRIPGAPLRRCQDHRLALLWHRTAPRQPRPPARLFADGCGAHLFPRGRCRHDEFAGAAAAYSHALVSAAAGSLAM